SVADDYNVVFVGRRHPTVVDAAQCPAPPGTLNSDEAACQDRPEGSDQTLASLELAAVLDLLQRPWYLRSTYLQFNPLRGYFTHNIISHFPVINRAVSHAIASGDRAAVGLITSNFRTYVTNVLL